MTEEERYEITRETHHWSSNVLLAICVVVALVGFLALVIGCGGPPQP